MYPLALSLPETLILLTAKRNTRATKQVKDACARDHLRASLFLPIKGAEGLFRSILKSIGRS